MSLRCVVGNCTLKDDLVERCYWGRDLTSIPLEEHGYLDLCWYHQVLLGTYHHSVEVKGWDKK